ncbi:putative peptidase M24B family protein [Lyophyllum shimeji]|uniref:Peptidase M24B family protein n=1 Tax=Lyophyllum shimeji TaxID=47721 RepID=A0A9P3PPG1_LYOSH|nr:putative peptidase M24B family protein [Lyophyllum shimeji]
MGATGTHRVNTTDRLAALRKLMAQKEYDVQAYVVTSEDEHSSEYLADCDQRRAYISGFNGSAGCAVITLQDAFLFTDGRYFLQAEKQLDDNWTLMKQGLPDVPTWQEFLSKNLEPSTRIGIDPKLITASDAKTINKALEPRKSTLVPIEKNLIDEVWTDRPPRPHSPVIHLDEKYSGKSPADKVKAVREELAQKKYQAIVVNMLDEVAWLFNLRGSDIAYNPVFFAYAVVTHSSVELFVEKSQLTDDARKYLGDNVNIHPYDAFWDYLRELPDNLTLNEESKVLIGERASLAIALALSEDKYDIASSTVTELKAIKNPTEIEGFRQSHIRDGAALARYFAWLEEQLNNGVELNESQGADKLEQFRSELDLFRGLSFNTISSAGPNAAIIHYSPDPTDCAMIKKDQIYLCDSGAQFLDGTTDVTRTWHFGTPTDEEKRAFTRVLQGHIAFDTLVFPTGTTGYIIDAMARRALWQEGLDYRHGTGHGVGHYLNVHEGPHGIGVRIGYNSSPLKVGMTVSNEPGYYADGRFGIRIESIVIVREVKTPNNFGDKGYLGFECVTWCPIQKKLVDTNVLTAEERKWLNDYHATTWAKVSPLLKKDERALKWLERECAPL